MSPAPPRPSRRPGFLRRHWYDCARALLLLWALGLAAAAVQLGEWRRELTRTLVQIEADAQFRARAQRRDAVDPEWYRRKALSLLSATDRVRQNAAWNAFIPGSWHVFDRLELQLQERLAREFGEIVVETIRRELHARASQLTGIPLAPGTGELQNGVACRSPVPPQLERKLAAAAEEMPEFSAVASYVAQVEQLDAAVQDFLSLQYASGRPEQLRKLVAYTLKTELPGDLARSVALFHGPDEVSLQPALLQARLQQATRCSLAQGMSALHGRLLASNDLFALEQGLQQRSAGLFDPAARPAAFDRTLERYRAVRALLDDQEALLARGRSGWMRNGEAQLGAPYQQLLQRIGRTRLLGPEVVGELESQSGTAFREFRRQFEAAFGTPDAPGIVWLEREQRFGLSPARAGLRAGLAALLETPFMHEDGVAAARPTGGPGSLAAVSAQARALADARMRFFGQHLARFPAPAQAAVQRVVDARVSELVYQQAYRALKAALPADPEQPLDPFAFRQQRAQVLQLQALLRESGGGAFGERLLATLDGEVLRRLALMQDGWRPLPPALAQAGDFGWWQGDSLSVAQLLGAGDGAGVPAFIARIFTHLEQLQQPARSLLALAPGVAADPSLLRWRQLQAELARYRARQGDSSLLRLERWLLALGPDLRRENCAERLAALAPAGPAHEDDIGQRLQSLHAALLNRCTELRTQAASVDAPAGVVVTPIPSAGLPPAAALPLSAQ